MVMNSNVAYFKNQVQSNEKIQNGRPKDPIIPKARNGQMERKQKSLSI